MVLHSIEHRGLQSPPSNQHAVLAGAWLIATIETIALAARLYVRYWRFTRFYWDDFFCVVGWAFSIPLAVQTTLTSDRHILLDSGADSLFLGRPMTQFLFYTSLWSIKISFLIFFRRIGISALENLRKYWIGVFCFTILTYGLIWTLNPLTCWAKKGLMECERDPSNHRMRPISFSIATMFDILSDCLIVVIPFVVLSHMRLTLRQKLALYSLFSLEVITMLVAIIRCAVVATGMSSETMDVLLLLILTQVAAGTSVVVACMSSLRSLFTLDAHSTTPNYERGSRRHQLPTDLSLLVTSPCPSHQGPSQNGTLDSPNAQSLKAFEVDMPFDHGGLLKAHP